MNILEKSKKRRFLAKGVSAQIFEELWVNRGGD
jgi:hypothetical protein